jgi:hypothetical protein
MSADTAFLILMPVCFLDFFVWSHIYRDIAVPMISGGGGGSGDPNFCCPISFSWVKIRLYTQNQLPRSSGSALKVCGGWVGGGWVVGAYRSRRQFEEF